MESFLNNRELTLTRGILLCIVLSITLVSCNIKGGEKNVGDKSTENIIIRHTRDQPSMKSSENGSPAVSSENPDWKINGISYVAPFGIPLESDFIVQKEHNATYTAITPYSFYDDQNGTFIFDSPKQWQGERTEGTLRSITAARKAGLKIMLKPHVWVRKNGWCGDLKFDKEEDWNVFWEGYCKYILHFAKIADSLDLELFCMGVEFRQTAVDRSEDFRQLIADIRTCYRGKLVYASNWDFYTKITFWQDLDYIGIDAYFPLSQEKTPTKSQLNLAWSNIEPEMKKVSELQHREILFTEYGYRSIDKCAGNQWELEDNWKFKGNANTDAQKIAYEALYANLWNQKWFRGGFVWKWYTSHKSAGGSDDNDYTPQNKPAAEILKKYYGEYR